MLFIQGNIVWWCYWVTDGISGILNKVILGAKSPCMVITTNQVCAFTYLRAQPLGQICECFSQSSMGFNSPARDWGFFVLHSISSQEDMVFVPKHFNVYGETMAWNKRREAERQRDNEVSQLRESTPCTIIWKSPRLNSFAVLGCVRAAGAFAQLWWSVYSVLLFWCGGCCLRL